MCRICITRGMLSWPTELIVTLSKNLQSYIYAKFSFNTRVMCPWPTSNSSSTWEKSSLYLGYLLELEPPEMSSGNLFEKVPFLMSYRGMPPFQMGDTPWASYFFIPQLVPLTKTCLGMSVETQCTLEHRKTRQIHFFRAASSGAVCGDAHWNRLFWAGLKQRGLWTCQSLSGSTLKIVFQLHLGPMKASWKGVECMPFKVCICSISKFLNLDGSHFESCLCLASKSFADTKGHITVTLSMLNKNVKW